jgi:hypothetical protein
LQELLARVRQQDEGNLAALTEDEALRVAADELAAVRHGCLAVAATVGVGVAAAYARGCGLVYSGG